MKGITIWGRDWEKAVAQSDFALLPLASFEYHGPMAPLGTDAAIAEAFAAYAQDAYRCVVYPPVYYTACPNKTKGAPTISVAPPTMLAYLIDVLRGIYTAGFSRVLLLNAHDGNMSMARAAAEAMEGPVHTLVVNWWELLSAEETEATFPDGGRGHGGPYELSCAWAALGQKAVGKAQYDLGSRKLPGRHVHVEGEPPGFRRYGGRISDASTSLGERTLHAACARLDQVVADWLRFTQQERREEDEHI